MLTHLTPPEEWPSVARRYRESGVLTHIGLGNRIVGGTVGDQIALIADAARENPTGALTMNGTRHHAHHVGSLLRPKALREAWRHHSEGTVSDAALRAAQDDAIRDVVAMQEQIGLRVVTDGEFRRLSYWNRFVEVVDGLEVGEARFAFTDESGDRLAFTAPHVTGKVKRTQPVSGHEVDFVRTITDRAVKVTLPSPSTMQFWFGPLSGAYSSSSAFFGDLARVYQEEIADLAGRGADIVQLDEVALAMLCDPEARAVVATEGENPDELVDDYVAAIRECVRRRPADGRHRSSPLPRQLQGALDGDRWI